MAYIEGIELTPKAKGAWVKYNNGFSLEPEHVTISWCGSGCAMKQ